MEGRELRFSATCSGWLNKDGTDGPLKLSVRGIMREDGTNKHVSGSDQGSIFPCCECLSNDAKKLEGEKIKDEILHEPLEPTGSMEEKRKLWKWDLCIKLHHPYNEKHVAENKTEEVAVLLSQCMREIGTLLLTT